MRIASLVPSSTEMLFALGLGEQVVGVTHECDFPAAARELPQLTATVLPEGLSAGEIDVAVKEVVGAGRALYTLDEERLAALEPDLIVTQAVCEVCAVSYEDVVAVAARLPGAPQVLQQDPSSLGEVLEDVSRLGTAAGIAAEAAAVRAGLERRLGAVRAAVAGAPRPRVLALEWLDPPFLGGHWVPEMIEIAGGRDVAGAAGAKSPQVGWEELAGRGRRSSSRCPAAGTRSSRWRRRKSIGSGSPRSGPSGSSPSTPPRPSRARARAWSRAPSCLATCSIPSCSRRPPGSASTRSGRRAEAGRAAKGGAGPRRGAG